MATSGKIFITTGRSGGKTWITNEILKRYGDHPIFDEDYDETKYWDKKEINSMLRDRSHCNELYAMGVDRRDVLKKSYVCVNGRKYHANNFQVEDRGPREALKINVSAIFEPENEIVDVQIPYVRYSGRVTKAAPLVDIPDIKHVIFNYPATIVFWTDGTKTVVKCKEGDQWDPHAGISAAIAKKFFGTQVNKWVKKAEYAKLPPSEDEVVQMDEKSIGNTIADAIKDVFLGGH